MEHCSARWAAGRRRSPAAGIKEGGRVALADWGGVRSTAVTLAAAHLGAATAQMNPLLTADELAQLAEVAGCSGVGVADDGAAPALARALGANPLGRAAGRGPAAADAGGGG